LGVSLNNLRREAVESVPDSHGAKAKRGRKKKKGSRKITKKMNKAGPKRTGLPRAKFCKGGAAKKEKGVSSNSIAWSLMPLYGKVNSYQAGLLARTVAVTPPSIYHS